MCVHVQGAVSLTLAIIIDEEPLISRHGLKASIRLLDVVFSYLTRVEREMGLVKTIMIS